jgi:hypothetical protein
MSMQINVDPAGLTQEQREAVAGFILAYPSSHCHTGAEIHDASDIVTLRVPTPVADAVAANPTGAAAHLADEIQHLAREGGEFEASVAFGQAPGDPVAAAAFGSAPAPLPHGATAAPSIAVAAPSLTAPADTTGTTLAATSAPVPPAPNVAPIPPAPIAAHQTGNPASGVDLDKHGLPWDGRIHAGTKRKNADGSWTAKRGGDPAVVAQVEAELRQVMGAPAAAPLAPVVSVPPPPVASPVAQAPAAPIVAQPPPPVAPSGDARQQFVGLVGRASAAIQAQKVTQAEVNQCCVDAGVPALPLLANRLDLVAQVAAHVDALIAARQ